MDDIEKVRLNARAEGLHLQVTSIDKFPRMTDYVAPKGVRIADADRVRLGAHPSRAPPSCTRDFVNFNAGTLGTSMVEGRISAGVVVGDGSDIGGGASTWAPSPAAATSGSSSASAAWSAPRRASASPSATSAWSRAGLYVTAGTRVTMPDGQVVKARELSGASNILFRRNSVTGTVEARPNNAVWGGLNDVLHSHN